MIERHPHVFGDVKVENSEEVLKNWEDIKKKNRGQKKIYEAMEGVTRSLPALYRGTKIVEKAQKGGFIEKEPSEIVTGEEIGKRLFELVVLSCQNGIDAEQELSSYIKKFIKKIKNIEENT